MTKTKKNVSEVSIDATLGNKLFEILQVNRLRLFFEKVFPEKKIMQRGANILVMNCLSPHHQDKHPSFYIHVNQNLAYCKSCHYRTRNLLELMQNSVGFSYSDCLTKIYEITGFRALGEKEQKQLDELDIYRQALKFLGIAANIHLINLIQLTENPLADFGDFSSYYNPLTLLGAKPAMDWLFGHRGLDKTKVIYFPYGLVPSTELFNELSRYELEKFWAIQYETGNPTSGYTKERKDRIYKNIVKITKEIPVEFIHSVCFITGYSQNSPAHLRLRRIDNGNIKDGNFWNTPSKVEGDVGFFGLYSPQHRLAMSNHQEQRIIIVEGEIDMLSAQEKIISNGISDVQFIASCGANNNFDLLFNAGIIKADLLSDDFDPAYGRGEDWLKSRLMTSVQLQTRIFTHWPKLKQDDIGIKDPDDVIRILGWDHFYQFIFTDAHQTFASSEYWVSQKAIDVCRTCNENETRTVLLKAAEWGQCVRHPASLAYFITKVCKEVDIPPAVLRSEIIKNKDNEIGFIARLVEVLNYEFKTLYKEENGKYQLLHLYHRKGKKLLKVPLTDGSAIIAALSNIFGEMFTFIRDTVGLPYMENDPIGETSIIREGQKFVGDYLKIALQSLYQGVPTMEECKIIGSGIHYGGVNEYGETVFRIHNGNRWFKLFINENNTEYRAIELDAPIDEDCIFKQEVKAWTNNIESISDIEEAKKYSLADLRKVFYEVQSIFFEFWKFRHHEEDCLFLAGFLFAMAAGGAFDIKNLLRIIGKTGSGKSTALAVLSGGQYPALKLGELVEWQSNYSQAGLVQSYSGSTVTMALEEYSIDTNNPGSIKNKQVENITELSRQIPYEGGATIKRFGLGGAPISYNVHTHMLMSSIHEPRDSQDISRSYIIETVKDDQIRDPVVGIYSKYADEQLQQLRRKITLGVLPHLAKLHSYQTEIFAFLNRTQLASYTAPSRFLRNFATVGSVFKLLDLDWKTIVKSMIETRREKLASQENNNLPSILYDRIIRTAAVHPPQAKETAFSILQLLTMPQGYMLLNSSGIGLYLNPNNSHLLIDWIAATSPTGLFSRMDEYQKMGPYQLKHQLDQHSKLVPVEQYKEYGVKAFLAANHVQVDNATLSVLNLQELKLTITAESKEYAGADLKTPVQNPNLRVVNQDDM